MLQIRVVLVLATAMGLGLQLLPAQKAPPATSASLQADGLNHFYNLEYAQAIGDFQQATQLDPANAGAWNHLAQSELYQEMYRIGALESELYGHGDPFLETKLLPPDPKAITAVGNAEEQALKLATAAEGRDAHDPVAAAHAHYDAAAAWALRANLDFSIKHSYWAALGDAKAARKEAEAAEQLDPGFIEPQLIIGAQNYVAGSLPWSVRMLSTLIGYRGNKDKGRAQVAAVAASGANNHNDAAVLLAVIDRRDGLNHQAAPIFARLASEFPRNPLFAVEAAEALEAAGEHDAARAAYQAVISRAAAHAPGYERAPLDKVWYDLGKIAVVYSNWQRAVEDFGQAQTVPGARIRYRQAAALAAGLADRKAGNPQAADAEFQTCINMAPDSNTADAAREAMNQ